MKPYFEDDACALYLGDSLEVIPTLPDASVDAVVTDAPYALANLHQDVVLDALTHWLGGDRGYVPSGRAGFMGKSWDGFVPPPAIWDECLRVLKPGGHLLCFAAPRTVDLMGLSLRIAGFEIRDSLHWIFGSGMPKGVNISKAIDKRREDRPEVLEVTRWLSARRIEAGWSIAAIDALFGFNGMASHWCATAGKAACVPTLEQWAVIRDALGFDDTEIRPLVEKLDGRKGEIGEAWTQREIIGDNPRNPRKPEHLYGQFSGDGRISLSARDEAKRWEGWNTQLRPAHEPIVMARKPTGFNTTVANVLQYGTGALHIDACRTTRNPGDRTEYGLNGDEPSLASVGQITGVRDRVAYTPSDAGRWPTNVLFGHSTACEWPAECAPGCPVEELDAQSGISPSNARTSKGPDSGTGYSNGWGARSQSCTDDAGGASRFFPIFKYQAKAPASERPKLADGTQHVSVKPLDLMRWLVRLVTPPNGVVLDPFAGSGSTLEAAVLEGFRAIGIEREQPYADLCVARLSKPLQPSLFGDLE